MVIATVKSVKPRIASPRRNEPSGSLARGLAVLETVREAPKRVGLAAIAEAAGLDHSTTLRLLRVLEQRGYVLRVTGTKLYAPSPKALLPLPLMHPISQLRRDGYPLIREFAEKIGETVLLAIYLDVERMAVDIAQSHGSLAPYYDTWLRGPRHATGVGKAILLSMGPQRRRAYLGPGPLAPVTPYTITDVKKLERDLVRSQQRGYVVARNEQHVGLTAMAANISSSRNGHVGCIAVTGHSHKFDADRITYVGEELKTFTKLLAYQVRVDDVANYLHG
jgi:IclR family acetate operon transcriptional repressor